MIRAVLFFFILLLNFVASANVLNLKIHDAVQNYILKSITIPVKNVTVSIRSLSPQLHLPDCPNLSVEYQNSQQPFRLGQQTMVVSCHKPYWQIYIEADIVGKVPVVVAKHATMQNEALNFDNLNVRFMSSTTISEPYFTSLKNFHRVRAKTYIPSGAIIRPGMLERPYLIKRGDEVSIVVQSSQIYIRMKARAIDNGMKGDMIRVQNLSSGKVVQAEVVSPMIVSVG